MNEKLIESIVKDFAKTGNDSFDKVFKLQGKDGEYYTVSIKKEVSHQILLEKRAGLESRSNTISALPSGVACSCCNGSGRSS
ncbi:MAG: hypothetical protein J6N68_03690 [Shewanella sp.]|nr:hypothetical protein [Shewanella sp.]